LTLTDELTLVVSEGLEVGTDPADQVLVPLLGHVVDDLVFELAFEVGVFDGVVPRVELRLQFG
jgi:hypothetical protein